MGGQAVMTRRQLTASAPANSSTWAISSGDVCRAVIVREVQAIARRSSVLSCGIRE